MYELLEKLRKYRWCHNKSSKYYSNRNKLFTIPPIIFSSISSFIILEDDGGNKINHYLSASFSMLTAMLSGVSLHLGFNAKSECHLMSANSYDELITKLDLYLRYKQTEDSNIVNEMEERILKIKGANKYQIPQWVFREYSKLHENKVNKSIQTINISEI